tara:strand:- start:40340 stop:40543 length:204 start_codon:yes stop_codon:yes gene_type:complete
MKTTNNDWLDGAESANKMIMDKGIEYAVKQSLDIDWHQYISSEFKSGFLACVDNYLYFTENRDEKAK